MSEKRIFGDLLRLEKYSFFHTTPSKDSYQAKDDGHLLIKISLDCYLKENQVV